MLNSKELSLTGTLVLETILRVIPDDYVGLSILTNLVSLEIGYNPDVLRDVVSFGSGILVAEERISGRQVVLQEGGYYYEVRRNDAKQTTDATSRAATDQR